MKQEDNVYVRDYGTHIVYKLTNPIIHSISVPKSESGYIIITTQDLVLDNQDTMCHKLPKQIMQTLSSTDGVSKVEMSSIGSSNNKVQFNVTRGNGFELGAILESLTKVTSPYDNTLLLSAGEKQLILTKKPKSELLSNPFGRT